VSATGSAGTLAAGDYLKTLHPGAKTIATEAFQCPTLLMNGFGDHRIEGIGDKHVPWVHNVRNTDAVAAIDDEDCMRILRLFNEPAGKAYLAEMGVAKETIEQLGLLGISGVCNMLAAIKAAKYWELNENDVIFTVFTDSGGDLTNSLVRTLRYAIWTLPIGIILALMLAFLLNQNLRAERFWRFLYFSPLVTSVVSIALIFSQLFLGGKQGWLNALLLQLGLVTPEELSADAKDDDDGDWQRFDDGERKWVLTLADKLRRLFDYDFPGVHDLRTSPVWAAGELLQFGGDFNKYVTSKGLQKQEGMVFRHALRLILLLNEFVQLCPPDTSEEEWRGDLGEVAARLTESCRRVDPSSTDKALEVVEQEAE